MAAPSPLGAADGLGDDPAETAGALVPSGRDDVLPMIASDIDALRLEDEELAAATDAADKEVW